MVKLSTSKKGDFARKTVKFEKDTLTWEGQEENGYQVKNRVTKMTITGVSAKFNEAYLCLGDNLKKKIQLVKGDGYVLLEFVAMANKDWKIILC